MYPNLRAADLGGRARGAQPEAVDFALTDRIVPFSHSHIVSAQWLHMFFSTKEAPEPIHRRDCRCWCACVCAQVAMEVPPSRVPDRKEMRNATAARLINPPSTKRAVHSRRWTRCGARPASPELGGGIILVAQRRHGGGQTNGCAGQPLSGRAQDSLRGHLPACTEVLRGWGLGRLVRCKCWIKG